ncbi:hypothetical protein [Novipirellula caenicola]|uniref:DUF2202 domain-containing protein n=1 Tax=Novipirellula caenicola TaxID=1536901 RepID=A0ABP9VMF1_9BACT
MNRLFASALITCFLSITCVVVAEDAVSGNGAPAARANTGLFSGVFSSMADVTIQASDKYLDYLAKPETAKKLATFQKNYYDSLIELGFDKEQAFTLLRDLGNPMIEHGTNRSKD